VPYQLGVDLGTTYTAAAVAAEGSVEIVQLGSSIAPIPSVVLLREDGTVLVGEAAQRRSIYESGRTAREFKRRLGDTTPYLLGGTPFGAEALTGYLLASVVEQATAERGEAPDSIVLAHPAVYGPYKLGFLEEAARLAGVGPVRFVSEPVAAAGYYAQTERVVEGETIAVYDFGGGTLDLAVVSKTAGGFEIVGVPEGMERFGGVDLDQAVFGHIDAALGGIVGRSDPNDAAAMAALATLRASCRDAKEALSVDTDVTIPVMLPSVHTEVRLTRGEFEDMIRPRVRETMGALQRTVRSAGLSTGDISSVLLVGGASRIPLVAEMVREATGRPVAVDAHPKHAVAMGAALFERESDAPGGTPAAAIPVARASADEAQAPTQEPPAVDEPPLVAAEKSQAVDDPIPSPPDEPPAPVATPPPERGPNSTEPEASLAVDGETGGARLRWPLIAAAIAAVVVVVIIGGYLLTRGGEDPPEAAQADSTVAEVVGPATITPSPERVAAVYHVGYRTPDPGESWGEWAAEGRVPPDDIASDFYPSLGLYSSTEPPVVETHFEMMGDSSVGVVAILWRGTDSLDEPATPTVLDEAARQERSVAFVLELPEGSPPEVIEGQVHFLHESYSQHPALLRPTDPSPWTDGSGMLVIVVGLEVLEATGDIDIDMWRDTLDAVHETEGGVTVLAVSRNPMWVADAHFDGLVNGPSEDADPVNYAWAADIPDGAWFVPVVSPGWSSDWSEEPQPAIPRGDGTHYLDQWMSATTAPRPPNLVMILSFNAWNAGNQIEPAEPHPARPDGSSFRDYEPLESHGYLDLTADAVGRWSQL
jgi:actin-like ATPase involved in cell morphogenesis